MISKEFEDKLVPLVLAMAEPKLNFHPLTTVEYENGGGYILEESFYDRECYDEQRLTIKVHINKYGYVNMLEDMNGTVAILKAGMDQMDYTATLKLIEKQFDVWDDGEALYIGHENSPFEFDGLEPLEEYDAEYCSFIKADVQRLSSAMKCMSIMAHTMRQMRNKEQ